MNGTPMRRVARSVQLAVMAAPSTTVVEAVAEARRRHDPARAILSAFERRAAVAAAAA